MKKVKSGQNRRTYAFTALAFLFSFYALYNKALFNAGITQFDQPIYMASLLVSIFMVLLAIFRFKSFGQLNVLPVVLAALFPVSYILSSFTAVSAYLAVNEILIALVCFLFFMIGYACYNQERHLELAGDVILYSGFAVVLFGLLNWFGDASFWGLIQYSWGGQKMPVFQDAVWMASDGPRLSSVFQYPNTYAGYLIALILMSAIIMLYSPKRWVAYSAAFMMVPMFVSFFLTLSRGGMVVFPFVVLLLLFFLKPAKQIRLLIDLLLALILSLMALSPVNSIGRELQEAGDPGKYFQGCLILVAASVVYVLLYWLMNRCVSGLVRRFGGKIESWKWSPVYLPLLAIILGAVSLLLLLSAGLSKLFPDSVRTRIENISVGTQTVQERWAFYSDALKIFADYPLLGAGGGGWKALFQSYQSYPYVSTNVHNFYLQHLVETGIIGFVFFVLLIGVVLAAYIRFLYRHYRSGQDFHYQSFALFAFACGILGHSLIDFDMKYVYLIAVIFFIFGVLSRYVHFSLPRFRFMKAIPWAALIAAVFALYLSGRLLVAHASYQQAISAAQSGGNFNSIANPLNKAVSLSKNPEYLLRKLYIYQQAYQATNREEYKSVALKTADEIRKHSFYNVSIYLNVVQFYQQSGMTDEVRNMLELGLELFPWDMGVYERAIAMYREWGTLEPDHVSWNRALEVYEKAQDKVRILEQIPEGRLKGSPFYITTPMAVNAAQIYYMQKDYENAVHALQSFVRRGQQIKPDDRPVLRLYLASLEKLGRPDQALSKRFFAAYPEEEDYVKLLVHE